MYHGTCIYIGRCLELSCLKCNWFNVVGSTECHLVVQLTENAISFSVVIE